MTKLHVWYVISALAAVAIVAAATTFRSYSEQASSVAELAQKTHFHGIAVDSSDPSRIYLATHHGLFVLSPDGRAARLSENRDDFMGFTPHPSDPSVLYASGHPSEGGNLGFIGSTDGGQTWRQLGEGAYAPADFHQMDVSAVDPSTIFGIYGTDLQVSHDGGRTWQVAAQIPDVIIDLAASAKDDNKLYAASKGGLLQSNDGGKSWQAAFSPESPATMVETTVGGDIFAFVIGTGLVRATEPDLDWRPISNGFGDEYVLHLAVDPAKERNLYAITLHPQTHAQAILASRDGGQTWSPLQGEAN